MNYKLISIILVLILLGIAGFFSYNYVAQSNYEKGYNDAISQINRNILNQFKNQGYVELQLPTENGSQQIKLKPRQNGE